MIIRVVPLAVTILASQSVAAQQVIRVKANNAPDWGPNAKLVEEFSMGDDRSDYVVRFPIKVASDDSGAFYVYDDRDMQIRRYDSRGVFERNVGRRGNGSDEYQSVCGMRVTRDGLLVVFDQVSRRIAYFQADGKVHHDVAIGSGYNCGDFAVDSDGLNYLTERLQGPWTTSPSLLLRG